MKLRRRETGLVTELTEGLLIGRAKDCQLSIQESSVSRMHARVEMRDGVWWLVDLKSSNGIACNGQRQSEFELRGGDLVTFGTVAFDVLAPATPAASAIPATSAASAAAADEDLGIELEMPAPTPEPEVPSSVAQPSAADLERARLRREAAGSGRSRGLGDLSQQPAWVIVLILAAGVGVIYGVGIGVRMLMGAISPTG